MQGIPVDKTEELQSLRRLYDDQQTIQERSELWITYLREILPLNFLIFTSGLEGISPQAFDIGLWREGKDRKYDIPTMRGYAWKDDDMDDLVSWGEDIAKCEREYEGEDEGEDER